MSVFGTGSNCYCWRGLHWNAKIRKHSLTTTLLCFPFSVIVLEVKTYKTLYNLENLSSK